jgi:hypothetical protein
MFRLLPATGLPLTHNGHRHSLQTTGRVGERRPATASARCCWVRDTCRVVAPGHAGTRKRAGARLDIDDREPARCRSRGLMKRYGKAATGARGWLCRGTGPTDPRLLQLVVQIRHLNPAKHSAARRCLPRIAVDCRLSRTTVLCTRRSYVPPGARRGRRPALPALSRSVTERRGRARQPAFRR